MHLKYIENNSLKYMLYSFIFITLLIAKLYINIPLITITIIFLILIGIDIIIGTRRLIELEEVCTRITKGDFSDLDFKTYEEEAIKLTIKEVTDDYLLKFKEIEQEKKEFDDYIELWIHEIKLSIANLKNMSEKSRDFKINSEIENVDSSIERILALASTKQIASNNCFERIMLREVCNKAIKLQMNNILTNNIKIITNYDDSSIVIDKFWMTFMLKQIINNSTKYGANTIEVSVKDNIITISDDGLGIDSGELNLVYNKFYCGIRTKDIVKSTGIGLYLVKSIISDFGYTITLESSNKGLDTMINLNK